MIVRLICSITESKTEFIEEDGRDPHLLANLQSLGPVTIPPTITKMRQVNFEFNQSCENERSNWAN